MTAAATDGQSKPPADRVKVYLAGPYSIGDPCVNTHAMIQAANVLLDAGYIPFVPLLSHFWHTMTPRPYDDWLALDFAWLASCNVLLRLPGESKGADLEVAEARRLGIPVFESMDALRKKIDRFATRHLHPV